VKPEAGLIFCHASRRMVLEVGFAVVVCQAVDVHGVVPVVLRRSWSTSCLRMFVVEARDEADVLDSMVCAAQSKRIYIMRSVTYKIQIVTKYFMT
jgi:hypothetical protein